MQAVVFGAGPGQVASMRACHDFHVRNMPVEVQMHTVGYTPRLKYMYTECS